MRSINPKRHAKVLTWCAGATLGLAALACSTTDTRTSKAGEQAGVGHTKQAVTAFSGTVLVNQVGYLAEAKKIASVIKTGTSGVSFEVRNASTNAAVFTGTTTYAGVDAATNMAIHKADFSAFKTAGSYKVWVSGEAQTSVNFDIVAAPTALYPNLGKQIMQSFYAQRLGIAQSGTYMNLLGPSYASYNGTALQTGDTSVAFLQAGLGSGNVAKGHGDAGDDGKYAGNMAVIYWKLLHTLEFNGKYGWNWASWSLNIPEAGGALPDTLDEIMWGVNPILGMCPTDTTKHCGHSIHDGNSAGARRINTVTTEGSQSVARVGAHVARVLAPYDATLATTYWNKAKDAYTRATTLAEVKYPQNESPDGSRGGYLEFDRDDDDYAMAVEMYLTARARGDAAEATYRTKVTTNPYFLQSGGKSACPGSADWGEYAGGDACAGTLSLLTVSNDIATADITRLKNAVVSEANQVVSNVNTNGFPSALNQGEYRWGSIGEMVGQIQPLMHAYRISGDSNYAKTAYRILDWIFGTNGTKISFVPGWGENPETTVHHGRYMASAPYSMLPGGPLQSGFTPPSYQSPTCSSYLGKCGVVCSGDNTPFSAYDALNYNLASADKGSTWCSAEATSDIQGNFLFAIVALEQAGNLAGSQPVADLAVSHVAKWKNDAKSAYSITHDDFGDTDQGPGQAAHWMEASNRGIHNSWGPYGGAVSAAEAQILGQMVAAGHEIMNHTQNHCDLVGAPWNAATGFTCLSTATLEIQTGKASIKNIYDANNAVPLTIRGFIYPYDSHDTSTETLLYNDGYMWSRGGAHGNAPANPADINLATNPRANHQLNFDTFCPDCGAGFTKYDGANPALGYCQNQAGTATTCNDAIGNGTLGALVREGITTGGFVLREFHSIGAPNEGTWGRIMLKSYTDHLDYVAGLVASGDVWNDTVRNVVGYRSARDRCLANNYGTGASATYKPTASNGVLTWNATVNNANCQAYQASFGLTPLSVIATTAETSINCKQNGENVDVKSLGSNKWSIASNPTQGATTCTTGSCIPQCSGKTCGSDGCGGSCGTCNGSDICNYGSGVCEACVPQCSGKVCGADGCGGTCGSCTAEQSCKSDQTACVDGTPFGGVKAVPGTIQAEDFDNGGEGISWHETSATNEGDNAYRSGTPIDIETGGTGKNVGYTTAGEWLEYTANVATSGTYDVVFRTAGLAAQTVSLQSNGVAKGSATTPVTGGWQSYGNATISNVNLSVGQQDLRFVFDTGLINIDYVTFTLTGSSCTPNCAGKICGSDGCSGSCGSCSGGLTCNASQTACECIPTTCAAQGKNCGSISDGCGGTLTCGSCSGADTCNDNVCTGSVPSGAAVYLKMDEASGTSASNQGTSSVSGTLNGAAFTSSGKFSNGVQTTAITNNLSFGQNLNGTLAGAAAISYSLWVNVNAYGAVQYFWYNPVTTGTSSNTGQNLSIDASGNLIVLARSATGDTGASTTAVPLGAAGAWHHVVVVHNYASKSIAVYVDGTIKTTKSSITGWAQTSYTPGATTGDFCFGDPCAFVADSFLGKMDQLRIYTRALTASEVTALYNDVGSCTPTTCGALGATCGTPSDGCGGSLSCGNCSGSDICLASNSCCTPTTCAALGAQCGSVNNACGGSLSCGSCGAGLNCNGSNQCVCTPSCSGKSCGDDGCGGSCGTCGSGQTCNASQQCIDTTAPSNPTNFAAGTTTSTSIATSWTAASDNVAVTGYKMFKDGVQVTTTASTSYTFTGLSASASYTLGVKAYDAAGNESALVTTAASTGACTPSCSGKQCGDDSCGGSCGTCGGGSTCNASQQCVNPDLKGHWAMDEASGSSMLDSAGTNNGTISGATRVAGKIGSGALVFDGVSNMVGLGVASTGLGAALNGATGFSVSAWIKRTGPKAGCSGLDCKQQVIYSYATSSAGGFTLRVNEDNKLNCGASSQQGDTFQTVSSTGTMAALGWDGTWIHATCVFDIAGDSIKMYVNGSLHTTGAVAFAATTAVNANTATADSVGDGSNRFFLGSIDQLKVFKKALVAADVSALYAEGSGPDTSAPSTPAAPTVGTATTSSLPLSWSASTDNVAVTGYEVYKDGVLVTTVTSGTSYTFTGLTSGTTYALGVKAYDAAGNKSAMASVNGTTTTPDTTAPTAPTALALGTITNTSIVLSFTAATDNVAVTGYKMYNGATLVTTVTTTSYTFTGLTAGTAYTLGVKAVDAAGNESTLATKAGTTTAPDTTAPTAPSNLTLGTITSSSIVLNWTASTDNVAVTGYRLYKGGVLVTTISPGTTYTFTGLTASTAYTFGVTAIDAAGNASTQPTKAGTTSAASGNCSAPAWVSGQTVAANAYRTATCVASPVTGTQCYGKANQKRAFKCVGSSWCATTNPNGTAADNGIWLVDATVCP